MGSFTLSISTRRELADSGYFRRGSVGLSPTTPIEGRWSGYGVTYSTLRPWLLFEEHQMRATILLSGGVKVKMASALSVLIKFETLSSCAHG